MGQARTRKLNLVAVAADDAPGIPVQVDPFPPELLSLIAPERQQIAAVMAVLQAKVVGFYTGKGETDLHIDLDAQTVTRKGG